MLCFIRTDSEAQNSVEFGAADRVALVLAIQSRGYAAVMRPSRLRVQNNRWAPPVHFFDIGVLKVLV